MGVEKWHVSVAFVCIILGVLLAIQFQTQQSISEAAPTRRVEELTVMLKKEEEYKKKLEKEASKLEEQLTMHTGSKVALFEEKPREVEILAGTTELKGPGVEIVLDDSKKQVMSGEDSNLYIIHNEDILKVVNELWAGGAEAIAVNDQRINATTEVTCAGPTISINKIRLVPPYRITALGDQETLYTSMNLRGGIIEALQYFAKQYGIEVTIEKKTNVFIPQYAGEKSFYYAKPQKVGG